MRYLIILVFLITASSCQYIKDKFERKDAPVARAFDKYLYSEDIAGIVPKGTTAKDSVEIVHTYLNNWIRQQVLLKQAEKNTITNQEEIEKQLENYRRSLIIYSYEQQLVAQKLDTVVSDAQIETYYNLNRSNFELKKSIVKASYAKIPLKAHRIDNAKKWFRSDKEKDKEELDVYCMQFASVYSLSDTNWFHLEQLVNIIPLDRFSENSILQKNNYIEFSDDAFLYLVKVRDYKYKDEVSPLEFEKANILNIIINKRKLNLVNEMEKSIYRDAQNNNDFEIFDDKK